MRIRLLLAIMILTGSPAVAQWTKVPRTPVPRTADGKPNLSAPAPRLPDGKPDFSGIWQPPLGYVRNLAKDLKEEEVPFQPWAKALYDERTTGKFWKDDPDANCLPQGVPKLDTAPAPWKLIQFPDQVVILYEAFTQWRQIFMDGRKLPEDPNPTWLGYSVGRWEGNTLVVESSGFNGKAWLDQVGHPTTEKLRVTEKFRRKDFGHLEIEITIDDPGAYTKPWTVTEGPTLLVDSELLEFVCSENEQDIKHMVTKK